MNPSDPIWVTATAAYTRFGVGTDRFFRALGPHALPVSETYGFPPLTPPDSPNRALYSDHRLTSYLLAAVEHDAGTFLAGLTDEQRERTGVCLGTAYGFLDSYLEYFATGVRDDYRRVNPRHFPHILPNHCTVALGNGYSLWGASTTIGTGVGAGLEALAHAAEIIRAGDDDIVLAGGLDELNDQNRRALGSGLTAPAGIDTGPAPDAGPGIPAGEGVAMVVLQSARSLRETGHTAVVSVAGAATTVGVIGRDRVTLDRGVATLERALKEAGASPGHIDIVFPSGTGARSDIETAVLEGALGDRAATVRRCLITPHVGECFAATGVLQCLAAINYLGGATLSAPPSAPPATSAAGAGGAGGAEGADGAEGAGGAEGADGADGAGPAAAAPPGPELALVLSAGFDGSLSALILRRHTAS